MNKLDQWAEWLLKTRFQQQTEDVIVTRSVLIYVQNKGKAAQEFYRVLRPGGRFSLFEPINSRMRIESDIDWTPIQEMRDWLNQQRDRRRQEDPLMQPMLDFNEQDLQKAFEQAGFVHMNLDLQLGYSMGSQDQKRSDPGTEIRRRPKPKVQL